MPRKQYHVFVHGKVQGVAFREYTRREAIRLNLVGWVRNLPNGAVEVLFEGEAISAEALLQWLHTGSPYAEVRHLEANEEQAIGDWDSFSVLF